MTDIIFIESGRKRKGEKYNCEFCSTEFVRRKAPYKKKLRNKHARTKKGFIKLFYNKINNSVIIYGQLKCLITKKLYIN